MGTLEKWLDLHGLCITITRQAGGLFHGSFRSTQCQLCGEETPIVGTVGETLLECWAMMELSLEKHVEELQQVLDTQEGILRSNS